PAFRPPRPGSTWAASRTCSSPRRSSCATGVSSCPKLLCARRLELLPALIQQRQGGQLVKRYKTWTLTDIASDVWLDTFGSGGDHLPLGTCRGWSIRKRTLHGGLRDGV